MDAYPTACTLFVCVLFLVGSDTPVCVTRMYFLALVSLLVIVRTFAISFYCSRIQK